MAQCAQPLTRAQSVRFEAAQALLREGRVTEAVAAAQALALEAPAAADAQQLLGMALAEAGDAPTADAAFRRALVLAPGNPVPAVNFAGWLRRSGRPREALAALEGLPESVQVCIQRGLAALKLQEPVRARDAFEQALRWQPASVQAWHGLGNALHEAGDLDGAEAAFRQVVALSPTDGAGWFALGVALRLNGRVDEALAALERARDTGREEDPQLQDAINGVLHDAGRVRDALAGARRLVAAHPGYVEGHETLANLLWENGPTLAPGEDPFAAFAVAAARAPDDVAMQLKLARTLLSTRRVDAALAVIAATRRRRPGDPMLDWYSGEAHDLLGNRDAASRCFDAAHRALRDSPDFLNAHARHAFRAGRPEQAARCAARVVELDPRNPESWAHTGIAWRLAGDPREHWLFDYDNLVGHVEVRPPPGFAGMDAFLDALTGTLARMHLAEREPLVQSVRNGSQTAGRLFGRNDEILHAAEAALRGAVHDWLATLRRDPTHPFRSRIGSDVRMVGSWSVRLRSSGRHSNHIHNEGWMSSAFHVALPPSVRDGTGDAHAGWLQFGQPMEDLGLDLSPRRLIGPKPGFLALFPSYMWHGTVPFEDPEPRLTVAFDMQPT